MNIAGKKILNSTSPHQKGNVKTLIPAIFEDMKDMNSGASEPLKMIHSW